MATKRQILTIALTAAAVLSMSVPTAPARAQGEIGEGVAVPAPNAVTEVAEDAGIGEQKISVADAEGIQSGPDARLVLRSVDGEVQEAACLARVKNRDVREASTSSDTKWPSVKLEQPLDATFEENDLVLQGESQFVPGQGEGVVAQTRLETASGAEALLVDDISKIDPWKQVLIRSSDGDQEEVRCLRSIIGVGGATRDNRDEIAPYFTVIGALDHGYDEEAEIIQSSGEGTGQGVVAMLDADAADGSSSTTLDSLDKLDRFSQVMIRDGGTQEVHCIRSIDVDARKVYFSQELGTDFSSGAEVVQGAEVSRALVTGAAKDRLKGCDCCGPEGAPYWWLASLAILPVVLDDDDDPQPPALSPFVP